MQLLTIVKEQTETNPEPIHFRGNVYKVFFRRVVTEKKNYTFRLQIMIRLIIFKNLKY